MNLTEFKEKFDVYLAEFIDRKIANLSKYTKDKFILNLLNHAKKLILSGGKRIRPYNTYLMYKNFGGAYDNKIFKLLIGLEILHNFLLIHDDIMDKSLLRRGITTLHTFTAYNLKKLKRRGDLNHIGLSQAICLGDLLYCWASQNFTFNPGFKEQNFTQAQNLFYSMLDQVIIGQVLDIDCTSKILVSDSFIKIKTLLKSASYTFIKPFELGAALAGASTNDFKICYKLGENLGMAFQIKNDLVDIISDQTNKKNPLEDITQGQHSFFTQYIFNKGTKKQKISLKKYFGKKIKQKDIKKIVKIFDSSGALDYGKKMINKYLDASTLIIKRPPFKKEYQKYLLDIVALLRP
jgi:geranylgeranyl diphosphate synthase type I